MTAAAQVAAVAMPRLSDSMEEGTILAWLAQDGATVARGEEIAEIETDKATMPYEAEADGVLHVLVPAGETVAVGAPIARIAPPGADLPAEARAQARERVSASPLARRIARELGVDLAALVGSGPHGRVVKADVLAAEPGGTAVPALPAAAEASPAASASELAAAAEAPLASAPSPSPAAGPSTRVPLSRARQLVGRRMVAAKAAPEFVLDVEVEMDAAIALRARLKALLAGSETPVPSLGDLVVKAAALALREHPRANAAFGGDHVEVFERVNVGVAVATDDALLVATVPDADRRGLGQIAADVRRLAAAARAGRLTPAEMAGATFTVSNLGMFGVDAFTAVLNPPQAAILAVGAVRERPVARDGELALARTMHARLTCDHRVLDGAEGAALLARVRALLEAPELLAL